MTLDLHTAVLLHCVSQFDIQMDVLTGLSGVSCFLNSYQYNEFLQVKILSKNMMNLFIFPTEDVRSKAICTYMYTIFVWKYIK